ncbi:hypothetical protein HPB49_021993 [Dermacentor silvarum]|uniref:Uncharacterized protein n=1 Tax=Dermacentor silvarum TaxID=543639 RepID=A0ACB8CN15_DERSI|nr:hypothetical protein HPB49_021993 [Dermacentor silvarum]
MVIAELPSRKVHSATCDLIGTKPKDDIFGPLVRKDGWHYFYLRDLLTSKQWDTTPDEAHYPARNMYCDVWAINAEHSGKPLVIAMAVNCKMSMWRSAISWGSTTDTIQAPVSVRIRYANSEDEDETEINIFNFAALGDSIHDDLLQAVKRGIPCHMWEVLRTDWPPGSDGISTLWEWCFVVPVSSDGENPLSLEEGTRFSYNLYDSFKNPPELIDLHGFDISPCYKGNDSVDAFLEVKLSASDYSTLSSSSTLNDPKFLSAWRRALDQASVLSDHSLRITRIKGYFSQDNTLFVTFVLLDRFPADAKVGIEDTQVSIEEMKQNLNKSVSQGSLGITFKGRRLRARLPSARAPTTPWEIITDRGITDDEPHDWDTTTSTYDIITELPVAYSTFATRYSAGVVGGTTAGLFLLGALIGASATYAKSAFFPTASLPTTVFH